MYLMHLNKRISECLIYNAYTSDDETARGESARHQRAIYTDLRLTVYPRVLYAPIVSEDRSNCESRGLCIELETLRRRASGYICAAVGWTRAIRAITGILNDVGRQASA